MSDCHYVFEEDDPTFDPRYEEEQGERWDRDEHERDTFVLDCGDAKCLMPGPHFLSECYTLEMAEAWERQFKPTPRLRKVRKRRQ